MTDGDEKQDSPKYEGMIASKSTKSTATGYVPTYLQFIKNKKICISLFVLSVLWTTTVFNYFMVQFVLYQYKED